MMTILFQSHLLHLFFVSICLIPRSGQIIRRGTKDREHSLPTMCLLYCPLGTGFLWCFPQPLPSVSSSPVLRALLPSSSFFHQDFLEVSLNHICSSSLSLVRNCRPGSGQEPSPELQSCPWIDPQWVALILSTFNSGSPLFPHYRDMNPLVFSVMPWSPSPASFAFIIAV